METTIFPHRRHVHTEDEAYQEEIARLSGVGEASTISDEELDDLWAKAHGEPHGAGAAVVEVESGRDANINTSGRMAKILRRAKFRSGGRAEVRDRRMAVALADAGKPRKSRSEKSRWRWRADLKRDEDIFRFINVCLRKKQPVQVTKIAAHTVYAAKKLLNETAPAKIIPPVGLPNWDHAAPKLKMLGWGMASWEMKAVPFTLGLSQEVIQKAQRDPRGSARHIEDRVYRLLKYRLGVIPAFWFVIEMGPRDQPHLHGAVVIPDGKKTDVSKALRTAGGRWTWKARQLKYSLKRGPITWVGYTTKWMYGTRRRLRDDSTVAASHSIRQAAQRWYNDARRAQQVLYPL